MKKSLFTLSDINHSSFSINIKNNYLKYFIYKPLIISFLLIFSTFSLYAFNIRVDIPKVKKIIKPGETITGSITLENPSSNNVKIRIYLEDFVYTNPYNGKKEFFSPGTTKYSCAKWISFSPQEITLAPFASRRVNYKIKVPDKVKGGYYAVMFFETLLGEIVSKEQGANIAVVGRVGTLFFLETEDRIKKAEIEGIKSYEVNKIRGNFINRGDIYLVSKGSFYVMDEGGMVLDRGKIDDIYISPQDVSPFDISLSSRIPSGNYTLILSFDLEDGDVLVREVDFSKDKAGNIAILAVRE